MGMIKYSNLNFPENGDPVWLSINLQRIDQWSTVFQLQGLKHVAVEPQEADWLFLGDRFLDLDNATTRQLLCERIQLVEHVVIHDLVHNYEHQHKWIEEGLPTWMPSRNYFLVTNSQVRFEPPEWLCVHYYDFLFNRTKAYYSGFPFHGSQWYFAGHHNYLAPCVKDSADHKSKVFLSPCRLYTDQNRTQYRKRLFKLMGRYGEDGYRSGPGRVKNGAWDKSPTGLYLASSADDPLINFRRLGWSYDPIKGRVKLKKKALKKWRGARWGGFNPIHNAFYEDTFVSIYGETIEYSSNVVITEKTYEPLIKGHFVLPFGSSGLVEAIRRRGFQLPEFIDYDYDLEQNDDERFALFTTEVKRIMRFPIHRWRTLWKEHIDLLRYNQRLFHVRDYDQLNLSWNATSPRAVSERTDNVGSSRNASVYAQEPIRSTSK